jgi:hypothetical protein
VVIDRTHIYQSLNYILSPEHTRFVIANR